MNTTTPSVAPPRPSTLIRELTAQPRKLIPVGFLIVLLITFSFSSGAFLSTYNVFSIGQSIALSGLIAAGLAVTMMVGEIDLSVSANVTVAGIVALQMGDSNPAVGVACALAVGALVGLLNGIVMVVFDLSSLVVTVATLIFLTGLAFLLAGGEAVMTKNFATGAWLDQQVLGVLSPRLLITVLIFVVLGCALRYTRFGRDVVATGSARKLAAAAGVHTKRTISTAFVLSGLTSGLAGALLAFSLGSVPPTVNANLLLQVVTIAIVGGVALSGGTGTITGVALGTAIIIVLQNGLSSVGANTATVSLVTGVVLLLFLMINRQPVRPLQ